LHKKIFNDHQDIDTAFFRAGASVGILIDYCRNSFAQCSIKKLFKQNQCFLNANADVDIQGKYYKTA
jgi:hypothetical protein